MHTQPSLGLLADTSRPLLIAALLARAAARATAVSPDFFVVHDDDNLSFVFLKTPASILFGATTTLPFSLPDQLIVSGSDALDVTHRALATRDNFYAQTPKYSVAIPTVGPEPKIVYSGNAADAAVAALAAHEAPFPGADVTVWDNHSGTQAAVLVWAENPSPRGEAFSKVGFRFFDSQLSLVAKAFQLPIAPALSNGKEHRIAAESSGSYF